MKYTFIILAALVTLSGCAATGPAFSPIHEMQAGQGVLYIYRPKTLAMGILSAIFDVDGQIVTTLENNNYAAIPITSGQHRVGQQWKAGFFGSSKFDGKPIFTTVTIKENQATFVRLLAETSTKIAPAPYPYIGFNTQFQWSLEEVSESIALPQLQQTNGAPIESQVR